MENNLERQQQQDDNNNDDQVPTSFKAAITKANEATTLTVKQRDHQNNANSPLHKRRRQWLFGLTCLFIFLFVGSFFGWGPMQLMLENNGAFDWKCDDDGENSESNNTASTNTTINDDDDDGNSTVCAAQTAALLNINLIAACTQILSPFLGQFLDVYGPKAGAYYLTACLWSGLSLMTLASARQFNMNDVSLDRLLYVGYALLAQVAWMGGLLTVQTGMYFTGHTKSRVIVILNSLFDGGSIMYLGLWVLEEYTRLSLVAICGCFMALSVLVMCGAMYFWTVTVVSPGDVVEEEEDVTKIDDTVTTTVSSLGAQKHIEEENDQSQSGTLGDGMLPVVKDEYDSTWGPSNNEGESATKETCVPVDDACDLGNKDNNNNAPTTMPPLATAYIPVSERTPRQQLLSGPYLLLCLFFAIQCTANQWNMSTMRAFLAYLGDDEFNNRYLTIFTLLMPVSMLALPLVDQSILRFGFSGAFQCINLLALGYSLIKVASDSLQVQILGFILFSCFRSFLFGVTFAFLPRIMGGKVVGKAAGIMYAITGLTSFLCIPLAQMAVNRFDGNFLIPNIVFCVLVLPCIAAAYGLNMFMKREAAAVTMKASLRQSSLVKNKYDNDDE